MKNKPVIAPSILSADFASLGSQVDTCIRSGGDWVHFDVMDNSFVPNLTLGPMVCKSLRDYGVEAPIDVHLMTYNIENLITGFAKAGATLISIHPESTTHLDSSINLIKDHGCKAGVVLNPATSISTLEFVIDKIDLILIMSVNPGFGGQKFIKNSLNKIRKVREIIDNNKLDIRLQVDGGITLENIQNVAKAGADTFVSGSAIFKGKDMKKTIAEMRNLIQTSYQ